MKNTKNIVGLIALLLVALLPAPKTYAVERLVFENDSVRPFEARTLIIDKSDKGGNLILQFGNTLNEKIMWNATAGKFVITDDLDVQGTLSGAALHAEGTISASGSLSVDGSASFQGAVSADSTLTLTGIGAGTDNTVLILNGSNQVTTDEIDSRVWGSTLVDGTGNTNRLSKWSDSNTLTDSGISDASDAVAVTIDSSERVGIGTTTPDSTLEVSGSMSGDTLYVTDSINGAGLTDCDNATTSKLLWDSATGRFSCGTDQTGDTATDWSGTGALQTAFDARYVNQSGDTMTGALTIDVAGEGTTALSVSGAFIFNDSGLDNDVRMEGLSNANLFFLDAGNDRIGIGTNAPETLLEVIGTASGRILHAQDALTASGTLSVDGNATFRSTLTISDVAYTFPGADGTSSGAVLSTDSNGQLSWALIGTGALKTRDRQIKIPINTAPITTDGTDNEANVYVGSQTGATVDPHHYYRVETGSGQLQDVDIRIQVLVPKDFVNFTGNTSDLSFTYKNTGATAADSKLDILVEDNDGDDAFTAVDGQGLFNTSWTTYTDEFDGGSFNPVAGEYIHITIKAYATSSGMPFAGEVVLTYTSR